VLGGVSAVSLLPMLVLARVWQDEAPLYRYIAEHASGREPGGRPPAAEAIVRRYAPVAEIINAVYWTLFTERRDIDFPSAELARPAIGALCRADSSATSTFSDGSSTACQRYADIRRRRPAHPR
jgi:hypothetical protein